MKREIICLGLPRTGTTSMAAALEHHGFNVLQFCPLTNSKTSDKMFKAISGDFQDFDAVVTSWLDKTLVDMWIDRFPDALYLYCYRDRNIRAASLESLGERDTISRADQNYIIDRLFHNTQCVCVSCAWADNMKWAAIATLLDTPIPDIPFPHVNKSAIRYDI